MTHRRARAVALAVTLAAGGPALADVISPDEAACHDKATGARCNSDGRRGRCQPDECCRNDYTNGVPPETVCAPCQTCQAGGDVLDGGPGEAGCAAHPDRPPFGWGAAALGAALALGLWRTRRRG